MTDFLFWPIVKTRVIRFNTGDRRRKRRWSNCVLCIPSIIGGSPNKCWLHTCDACVITTWRLGLRAPLVARNNGLKIMKFHCLGASDPVHAGLPCTSQITALQSFQYEKGSSLKFPQGTYGFQIPPYPIINPASYKSLPRGATGRLYKISGR